MRTEIADDAQFIAQSLLTQARQVRNFIRTYPVEFSGRRDKAGTARRPGFLAASERLLREVSALYLMARHPEIRSRCNREQIEALIADAESMLDGLKAERQLSAVN